MLTNENCLYSATCSALANRIQEHELHIKMNEANQTTLKEQQMLLARYNNALQTVEIILDMSKPIIRDIQTYITRRRENSLSNINNAIRMALEIIPDAAKGIKFSIENNEATVVTEDDLEVQDIEGGGLRHTLSAFLRSVILRSDDELLQTMFWDELFATVSGPNSATLSTYLNVIVQDQQVISIEQKEQIASNVPHITYVFEKDEDYSRVTRLVQEET